MQEVAWINTAVRLSPTAAALQLALLHHHHNQQQQHHQIPSPLAISIPGITETQPATNTRPTIKQECEEQINREELFSTLLQQQQQLNQEQISAASCSPSWINTNLSVNTSQQQQQAVNVLANLIGHIQQQKQNLLDQQQPLYIESQQQHLNTSSSSTSSSISAPTSRLAAIQEEQINLQLQQQSIVDNIGGDFERNQSTESTASTSGVKLSITTNVEPIPRKQDIQVF
ncbi:unnamed protein product [Meloidogyne enterolobii]|uniref:Uncharacterized protein n=1 Tax=Meloidogyne enterolobii TaxID=390850 RepID=A0ACB0ZRQ0_MELEN